MKRLYSLPTDDVILDCLANDVIDRNQDVVRFCSILDSFHECTVISLDGAWGSGKTFFVKQAKMLIDGTTDPSVFEEDIKEGFKRTILADDSKYKGLSMTQKHSTVYYDAWENDNDNDPILSIIYAVTKSKQVNLRIHNDRSAVDILSALAECLTGFSIASFSKAILGTDPMGEKKQNESISDIMHDFIDKAVGNKNDRLVIFIDELDRCKPTYAVSLLERIKHYFTDERLTFVFSVNQGQLQHTIRRYYGDGMDGSKYLEKLFDYSIPMPEANSNQFMLSLGMCDSIHVYDKISEITINYFHFGLREISKYFFISKSTAYGFAHQPYEKNHVIDDSLFKFCTYFIAPILIGLRIHNLDEYSQFIKGLYKKPFVDVLLYPALNLGNNSYFLSILNATMNTTYSSNELSRTELEEQLTKLYEIIFCDSFSTITNTQYETNQVKKKLLELVNPISKYASLTD